MEFVLLMDVFVKIVSEKANRQRELIRRQGVTTHKYFYVMKRRQLLTQNPRNLYKTP